MAYKGKPTRGRNYDHDRAAKKTYGLYGTAGHDYAAGSTAWTLDENECEATLLLPTNANGSANAILQSVKPGKMYVLYNGSGQAITLKVSGQTGIAVANTKMAILVCNATDIVRVTADT